MKKIKNFYVILISLIISLILAEIALRIFTDFKNFVRQNNMKLDSNFGFKVNPGLKNIDKFGFRNIYKKSENFQVSAIGDSHTYGYGVKSKDSWPNQLEKMLNNVSVYNYGVGGNGIYSYHFLINDSLKNNKKIILALYLPNDLDSKGYVCSINFNNDFWKNEVARLGLNPPSKCDTAEVSKIRELNVLKIKDFIILSINRSALLYLTYEFIYKPIIKKIPSDNKNIIFYKNFSPIRISRLDRIESITNLNNPEVKIVFSDFNKMLKDWARKSKNGNLGIILIPSRQYIYRSALEKMKITPDNKTTIDFYTDNEMILETKLLNLIHNLKIPVLSARNKIVDEFINTLPAKGIEKFYPDSGHPDVAGQRAYAITAKEIYFKMRKLK